MEAHRSRCRHAVGYLAVATLVAAGVIAGVILSMGSKAESKGVPYKPHVVEDDPMPISSMIPDDDPIYTSGYFQGDMMMTAEEIAEEYGTEAAAEAEREGETISSNSSRSLGAASSGRRKWPNNIIYYRFTSEFPRTQKDQVRAALRDYEALTNIKTVEGPGAGNYVLIRPGSGCSSAVGMRGGAQSMSLAIPGCLRKGIVLHEFMHALGFSHEHTAPDRDSFVTVNLDNVQDGKGHNFNRIRGSLAVSNTYDHSSVMHYSEFAFSRNRLKTIDCRGNPCGQRSGFSSKDVSDINRLYPPITPRPTRQPSSPTFSPTRFPTRFPTNFPTRFPTAFPTRFPTTASPTGRPATRSPTSSEPTSEPTAAPTPGLDWSCDVKHYNSNDGCNCGCGSIDPDCAKERVNLNARLFCGDDPVNSALFTCNATNSCVALGPTPSVFDDGNIVLIATGTTAILSTLAIAFFIARARGRRHAKRKLDLEKSGTGTVNPMAKLSALPPEAIPQYPNTSTRPYRPPRPER